MGNFIVQPAFSHVNGDNILCILCTLTILMSVYYS